MKVDVLKYFNKYQSISNGSFIRLIFLSFFIGFLEIIGLLLLVPLVENISPPKNGNTSEIGKFFAQFFNFFDVEVNFYSIISLLIIIYIARNSIYFFASKYSASIRGKMLENLRKKIFVKIKTSSFEKFSKRGDGYYINVVTEQVSRSVEAFNNFAIFGSHLIFLLFYVATIIYVSFHISVIAIAFSACLGILFQIINTRVKKNSKKFVLAADSFSVKSLSFFQSFGYLTSTGLADRKLGEIYGSAEGLSELYTKLGTQSAIVPALKEPSLLILFLTVFAISEYYFNSTLASAVVIFLILQRAMNALFMCQHSYQNALGLDGSVDAILGALKISPGRKGRDICIDDLKEIRLCNVSFGYDGEDVDILSNVSVIIPKNGLVVFWGSSGAGKSTLINVLIGLLKQSSGSISYGEAKFDVSSDAWPKMCIGFLPQVPVIFDGSLYHNLCPLDDDVSVRAKECWALCESLGLSEFIEELPDDYKTQVGDGSMKLSGGQAQRIALARELLRKPQLLVLDEPTSALDEISTKRVQEQVLERSKSIPVIVISHDKSWLNLADKKYLVKDGACHAQI